MWVCFYIVLAKRHICFCKFTANFFMNNAEVDHWIQIPHLYFAPEVIFSAKTHKETVLCLDLIKGKQLYHKAFLREKTAKDYINQASMILDELFKNGIIHCDISEFNIIISQNKVYLVDFGNSAILNGLPTSMFNNTCNCYYTRSNSKVIIDDALCFYKIFIKRGYSDDLLHCIKDKIGRLYVIIDLKNDQSEIKKAQNIIV